MRRVSVWVALVIVAIAALPAAASAAAGHNNRAAAQHALDRVKQLKRGIGARTGRELTPALIQLAARRSALDSSERKQAAALLARPTDAADPDYYGGAYIGSVQNYCPAASIFCFHWVGDSNSPDAPDLTDSGGVAGVPDYIEQMATSFDQVYRCENGTAVGACGQGSSSGLGWQGPVSDGDGKFDVYVKDLYPSYYGYAAPECPTPMTSNSCPAYMVMDKDYDRFPPVVPGETGADEMSVTAAHEYNHVLQMGYDVIEDLWMFESTAVYMEEKVYPSINDYFQYLPSWVNNLAQPITKGDTQTNLKIYGSAVWNHWLDSRYGGDDVIQSAWSQSPSLNSFAPDAYGKSIQDRGGAGFPSEFEDFAAAVAEWRVPGSGFPDLYPDVPSRPALTLDSPATALTLDHTTFAYRNIAPPQSATPISLAATLPSGLKGAIELVGRTGSSTTGGTVVKQISRTSSGGRLIVTLPDAQTFGRITAVFVNADPSQAGWSSTTQDWVYTKDAQTFAALRAFTGAVPPDVVTADATGLTNTSATLNGTVNPNASATTYWFEYGPTSAYGSQLPATPADAGSGTSPSPVAAAAGGLIPATTYHYRIVARNAGGTTAGADQSFKTLAPPAVMTGSATGVGPESATLNATVDPHGQDTTFTFEYGPTRAYGHKSPLAPRAVGSAAQPLAVTALVNRLKPGATVHFRVVATNAAGVTQGSDSSFRTKRLTVASSVSRTQLRKALTRGLRTRTRCNATCSVKLELLLPAKLARALHVKRKVGGIRVTAKPSGKVAQLRFAKQIARRLAGQAGLKLSLKMTATTKTGGRTVGTKPLNLKR